MATTVTDLKAEVERNSKKLVKFYNYDTVDFEVKYEGKTYKIHSMEVVEYPFKIANHIKKHLANHLLNKGGYEKNHHLELEKIMKKIEVK